MPPIVGHQKALRYFSHVLARGDLAHAYLFYGPEEIGKRTIAERIALALTCPRNTRMTIDGSCGECPDCRMIREHTHQSVLFFPEIAESGASVRIGIDTIRELKRVWSLAPVKGTHRIAIFDHAEHIGIEAANALLKLLEEPGMRTLFIFISAYPDHIPKTIRSRTQEVRFTSVPDSELLPLLRDSRSGLADDLMLFFADGRPGKLMQLIRDPACLEKERNFASVIQRVREGNAAEALRFSERIADDDLLREKAFRYLVRHLRNDLQHFAKRDIIIAQGIARKITRVVRVFESIATTNVSKRLALDHALLIAITDD